MAEWILLMHPRRANFIRTMTDTEHAVFARHAEWLRELVARGRLIVSGPCLGRTNTGVVIFEAPDDASAREIAAGEPVTKAGVMDADLRPFRMGHLRGRD
jgi:uncharacterized protein YciI